MNALVNIVSFDFLYGDTIKPFRFQYICVYVIKAITQLFKSILCDAFHSKNIKKMFFIIGQNYNLIYYFYFLFLN